MVEKNLIKSWEFKLGILLISLLAIMSLLSETFRGLWNLITVTQQMVEFGIIAIAMTFVIITGGIDLSLGSIVGLTTIVVASIFGITENIVLAIICGLTVSILCGFINGYLISKFAAPAMLITLGTQILYRGIALVISKGNAISYFPDSYYYIGQEYFFEYIPVQVLVLIVICLILFIVLNKTEFGKNIYNIGNNIVATKFNGVDVKRVQLKTYTLAGFLGGIAGIIISSRVSTARADLGSVYVLQAVAAVVLGGTNIAGGSGTVLGTMIGVLIFSVLGNGLNHLEVNPFFQTFIMGSCLIIVLLINNYETLKNKFKLYIQLKNSKDDKGNTGENVAEEIVTKSI